MKKSAVLLFALTLALSVSLFAKEKESFIVSGNCGMCKTRIEQAAKDAGATKAFWNEDSKILTVSFKNKKTNLEKVRQQIALVGHDNGSFKTEDAVYEKLPGCCKYERSTKSGTGGTQ